MDPRLVTVKPLIFLLFLQHISQQLGFKNRAFTSSATRPLSAGCIKMETVVPVNTRNTPQFLKNVLISQPGCSKATV